jgi:HlyD family secretion protein
LLFCLGGLVALPLVKVDITVRATGVVRPAVERIELKAAVSGRVARVFVKDNDNVTAGQPLLELSTRDLEERLSRNRALQEEKNNTLADLSLLTTAPPETNASILDAGQPELADDRFHALECRQSYLQVRAQVESCRVTLAKARVDLQRLETLAGRELVTKSDLDAARFAVGNAEAQELLIIRQALNNWKTSLRTEKIERDNLVSEEKRMLEEMTYATVRAPAGGTVQGFLGYAEGGWLVAGQSLGYVSPDAGLLVETAVLPKDIGLIQAGQTARLQIDAFPYTQWGLLDARVEQIAGDATLNGQQLYFRVLLKPQKDIMRLRNGVEGTLRKGMTLSARFVVNRRTLLQALYENTADWLNPQHGGSDGE